MKYHIEILGQKSQKYRNPNRDQKGQSEFLFPHCPDMKPCTQQYKQCHPLVHPDKHYP